MIKVKKSLSLLVIVFFILSNAAIAQTASSSSGVDEHGGANQEGINESQQTNNEGNHYPQIRKDAFSYENRGYQQNYDAGPSYESYDKEHMIYGRVFELIGNEVDPRDIKQYCNNPDKIADIVVSKLKEKVGDIQKICAGFDENEAKCTDIIKQNCARIGTAMLREGATEMEKIQSVAYSCPANKDAIIQACRVRSKFYIERNAQNTEKSCQERFDFQGEKLMQECEKFKQSATCDKDKFMERCMGGLKKEDFERKKCPEYSAPDCGKDSTLQKKTDANGCISYYCQTTTTATTQPTCPEATIPTCAAGSSIQKKTNDKGCVYYYCATATSTSSCKQDSDCEIGKCSDGRTYQEYSCESGACIITNHLLDPCLKVECTTDSDCGKGVCPDGFSYQKYSCSSNKCITVNYFLDPCRGHTTSPITGSAVLSTYDDLSRHCGNSWLQQQRICANAPGTCDKDMFIQKCKEQGEKNSANYSAKIGQHCESDTISEIKYAEQRCSKIEEERQRCLEQSTKRCEQMKGLAQECRSTLTEEKLRNFILEETRKRCRFTAVMENEFINSTKAEIVLAVLNTATQADFDKLKIFVDNLKEDLKLQDTTVYRGTINPNSFADVKLLPFVVNAKISTGVSSEKSKEGKEKIVAGQKAEDAASKLISLRDSGVPSQYLYIIEDKASDVLNVSDKLNEIEKKDGQKGIVYKMKLFLGLAKQAETEEIKQLEESKSKLQNSINTLTKLIDEVPSDVAKSILKEQVESLKKQQEEIGNLIKAKEKKSKGLLGIFG